MPLLNDIYDRDKPWSLSKVSEDLDETSSEDTLLRRFLLSCAALTNILKEEVLDRSLER